MSKITPPGLDSDPDIFKLLTEIDIIAHMAKKEFERILPDGITQAQFGVLNRLTRLDTLETVSELAKVFQVTQPTMTSTLKKLQDKSYIKFVSDAHDGRIKRVALTKAGLMERSKILQMTGIALADFEQEFRQLPYEILLTELGGIRTFLEKRV
jgi:DNA-binding MarR family transcriptional regulator